MKTLSKLLVMIVVTITTINGAFAEVNKVNKVMDGLIPKKPELVYKLWIVKKGVFIRKGFSCFDKDTLVSEINRNGPCIETTFILNTLSYSRSFLLSDEDNYFYIEIYELRKGKIKSMSKRRWEYVRKTLKFYEEMSNAKAKL